MRMVNAYDASSFFNKLADIFAFFACWDRYFNLVGSALFA